MDSNTLKMMSKVRESWSDQERRSRKERAGVIQLQLKALVTLSALSEQHREAESHSTVAASAC